MHFGISGRGYTVKTYNQGVVQIVSLLPSVKRVPITLLAIPNVLKFFLNNNRIPNRPQEAVVTLFDSLYNLRINQFRIA